MSNYTYYRVSSETQDFMQQSNCVNSYLKSQSIDPDKDVKRCVVEKVSGTVKASERKLSDLLGKCRCGDVVYFSELSRLGRNMTDLCGIVSDCCERGVILVQAKDGMKIENDSIGGKALLFALSLAAEIEVANIRQRTQMGIDARKRLLTENGVFVSKTGRICTKLGREFGCDNTAANEASVAAKQAAKLKWINTSPAFKWVREKVQANWPRKMIIEEFNKIHDLQPDVFKTRAGGKLTRAILCKWIQLM